MRILRGIPIVPATPPPSIRPPPDRSLSANWLAMATKSKHRQTRQLFHVIANIRTGPSLVLHFIRLSRHLDFVAGDQLSAAASLELAVHAYLPGLNHQLGLAAGV